MDDEEGTIPLCKFEYKYIKKHHTVIIIHSDARQAALLADKVLGRHRFHTGDIFTPDPRVFGSLFRYPSCSLPSLSKDAAQTKKRLTDIFRRQAGQYPTLPDEYINGNPELAHELQFADADTQALVYHSLQPMHVLLRRFFAPGSIPERVFQTINQYLIIPEAYLVLHHSLSPPLARQQPTKQCFLELDGEHNQVLRIITLPLVADWLLPTNFFATADFLVVFGKDEAALAALYRRAKLSRFFQKRGDFMATMQSWLAGPSEGLVFCKQPIECFGNSNQLFWTTDRVHRAHNRTQKTMHHSLPTPTASTRHPTPTMPTPMPRRFLSGADDEPLSYYSRQPHHLHSYSDDDDE